jgi:hypothetical protein
MKIQIFSLKLIIIYKNNNKAHNHISILFKGLYKKKLIGGNNIKIDKK